MPARNFRFKLFLLGIFTVIFLFTPKSVFAAWTKYSGNPILSGTPEWWDRSAVQGSSLLFEENIYKMWYVGHSGISGSGWRIGFASSLDGKSDWEKIDHPVIDIGGSIWGSESADPYVIHDLDGYKMWYCSICPGCGGSDRFRISYATSNDGIDWDEKDWVLRGGGSGTWDTGGPARGHSIIKSSIGYQMWYAATNEGWNWQIGYATSPDGIIWTKQNEGNPVIAPTKSWEMNNVSYPFVIYESGVYQMWYAAGAGDLPTQIVYATSNDGIHWDKPVDKNLVFAIGSPGSWDSTYLASPFVTKQGNTYKMWYSGYLHVLGGGWKIGYAENVLPEPTPIPSPTPTPLQPLILLPGLGASWNHKEIFLGEDQLQGAWYKTPFRSDYDGLIQTLQNAGYTLGQNLFVFYYNWLQPINQSADELKDYINDVVNPPPETKVDLIGHSLGGLVARTYIQRNSGTHRVDQLITLGSPHKGAPQIYKAWEGADLTGLLGEKERIGAGIILRLRGFGYPNLVSAIQTLVPSLDNLLFIDDYLKWNEGGAIKPEASMFQRNIWLRGLGISPELLALANTMIGTAGDTSRWLKIIERNQIDQILGRWRDGKPVGEEPALGDRAVLEESAGLLGANIITLAGLDHGDLVKKAAGLEKILELLGKSGVAVVEQPEIPFEPALVFTLASPATLRVTDPLGRKIGARVDPQEIPNGSFSEEEKIIVIPEALDGKYKVEVLSEGSSGSYNLLIGQLTQKQDIWSSYQDSMGSGEIDTYNIPVDNSLVTTDSYLARVVNSKLEGLLKEIKKQKINLKVKAKLLSEILKISGQTKVIPILLRLEKDKLALKHVQKAIEETTRAINYAEKFNPASLSSLREILDLLGQLHQLLED